MHDDSLVREDGFFKQNGAHGLVRKGNALQVIVGLDVPQVREKFEDMVNQNSSETSNELEADQGTNLT